MKKLLCATTCLIAITTAGLTARAEKAACTANIEAGKKYHWVTYQNGTVHESGWVMYTDKVSGGWTKVFLFNDKTKAKDVYWGIKDENRVNFKNVAKKERWTAWMKMCEGAKLRGNVYQNDKMVYMFDINTSHVRE
ncbi:MAG: hypothetical protein RBU30_13635 [Polyangia bacterium]|nr:hypothetical protein [Polyangia bacterium]